MDEEEDTLKRNHPKQLQTNHVFTNNMENPSNTDKRRNICKYSELFPEKYKGYQKRTRGTDDSLYTDHYILKQIKTKF